MSDDNSSFRSSDIGSESHEVRPSSSDLADDDLNHRKAGNLKWELYRIGNMADTSLLDEAIEAARLALESILDAGEDAGLLIDLGLRLGRRFLHDKNGFDLATATSLFKRALELPCNEDLDRAYQLDRLGVELESIFERERVVAGLDCGVLAGRCAVEFTPSGHASQRAHLHNLSNLFFRRFERTGELEDIEQVIKTSRREIELLPDGHASKTKLLYNLGHSLCKRFERTGELDHIDQAISAHRRALELTPDGDVCRPAQFINLGNSFQARFERIGELADIKQAIAAHRRAVELTPEDHTDKPMCLSNLGSSFAQLFERSGELDDVEQAIAALRRAVELTPDGHADKPSYLNNLGNSFVVRSGRTGQLDDIQQALTAHRRAVELTPDGSTDKPTCLTNLGNSLESLFERTGDLHGIEQAIAVHRRAVELTPDGHAHKSLLFNNLGNSFLSRFKRTEELHDIEQAISAHRRAVKLTPDGHASRPSYLSNLGDSFTLRFERTGELDDIEQAITAHRRTVELAPDGDARKHRWLNNLGSSLQSRFERTGELDDIEQAISAHRRGLDLTPGGHAEKPTRFNNLGASFMLRFKTTGELDDIEQAIAALRQALELMPDGHVDRSVPLINLGNSLNARFERTGELDDIEQAIAAHRRAIEHAPDDHAHKLVGFIYLGDSLKALCIHRPSKSDFDAAVQAYMYSITSVLGVPSHRLHAAVQCAHLHSKYPAFNDPKSLLSAYSHIIAVLPEIVWLGHDIHRRFDETARLRDLVSDAVSAAITIMSVGEMFEWLEAGRTLLWSQLLSLRAPLDDLWKAHPGLAAQLQDVRRKLQQTAFTSFALDAKAFGNVPGLTVNESADAHRQLALQYGSLLKQARVCPGFEDFLLPRAFDSLILPFQHTDGPIIYLHVDPRLCCALTIEPDHFPGATILLPDLTWERAHQLRVLWMDLLKGRSVRAREPDALLDATLSLNSEVHALRHSSRIREEELVDCLPKHMWEWIVRPVLEGLQLLNTTTQPPRITWCPTGPLSQLPLHAAGIYSDPHGPRAFDLVVSSYTPSLSALQRCHQGTVQRMEIPNMLIVTQPATPGQAPLPKTSVEGACIAGLLRDSQSACTHLNEEQSTVNAVRNIIDRYPWVHLACHGSQHPGDATQSAFALHDGPLSLADLMRTVADDAELAFLSACQTATGDSGNPEEAVHLAAGMLAVGFKGVVATMWSIRDEDGPVVVEAYYKKLIELRSSRAMRRGSTGAAYALHEAVAKLRAEVGEDNFGRWAPFVHFGA